MPFRSDALQGRADRQPPRPLLATLAFAALVTVAATDAHATLTAVFQPEPSRMPAGKLEPAPPTFRGRTFSRALPDKLAPRSVSARRGPGALTSVTGILDTYVQDGSETSVAVNSSDPSNAVVLFNEAWNFDPDTPIGQLTAPDTGWVSREFPTGIGIYGGVPFNPWCVSGNTAGTFYASMLRNDTFPSDNRHTILAYTNNSGVSFNKINEANIATAQDRAMFDIDRDAANGGTSGVHDGKVYLCYDDFGPGGSGFVGSNLRIMGWTGVSTFDSLSQAQMSGSGTPPSPPFRGNQFQPVAGTNDGQFFMVSTALAGSPLGSTVNALFHELTNGGATASYSKSVLSWAPAGQKLGSTTHWGVNGHRIDEHGTLAIDRSSGPRRGYLYFVSNRNPNPSDPSKDQGDVFLSVSVTRASSWSTARIPLPFNKTQYFPMLDVDSQGWLHLAYYQNENGVFDAGVLNAGRADVYYTVSRDGGQTWANPVRVNQEENHLELEDPPVELGGFDYYMIGDYMQIRGVGTGEGTTAAYVLWTGFNKYRNDDSVGDKKERVNATRVIAPAAPATDTAGLIALLSLLAIAGAVVLRRGRSTLV